MANTNLTTNNTVTALGNSELNKAVLEIEKAKKMGNTSAWVIATKYHNIVDNDLFDEDFESLKDFATYMGVSKGLITQYTKAVEFIAFNDFGFTANDLSIVRAYTLSTLENLKDFVDWCESNNREIISMSDAGLKAVIKEWKKELEAVEVETDTEENVSRETNTTEVFDEVVDSVEFEYNGNKYIIPIEVLAQYKVE